MKRRVTLVGLDFGSTTSSAVIADAVLAENFTTGRSQLTEFHERLRSEMVFTPFRGESLDEERLAEQLDGWLAAGEVRPDEIFGGGALLTGLAAGADNAAAIAGLVRRRLRDALVAAADDPCLEAWLAFMGNCASLSQAHPDDWILNLDIGGGTTNLALGRGGEVVANGCLFVGARHLQFQPGSYVLSGLSPFACALLRHLGVPKTVDDALDHHEVTAILDFYLALLEAAVMGQREVFDNPTAQLHEQIAFPETPRSGKIIVTLSGGVGELVYAALAGHALPPRTYFGDIGIDLARRLLDTDFIGRIGGTHAPPQHMGRGGRATAYGLLQHTTQVSGSTLFLPHPEDLPLADLPILGTVHEDSPPEEAARLLDLVRRSARGGCLRLDLREPTPAAIRTLGGFLSGVLRNVRFPPTHPLVIFVRQNVGKVLGQYITAWGALPLHVIVVDELSVRNAHYAHLGQMREQVVPVSVFGLQP